MADDDILSGSDGEIAVKIGADLSNLEASINKSYEKIVSFESRISGMSNVNMPSISTKVDTSGVDRLQTKFTSLNDSIAKVGEGLTKYVSVPLAALGAVSFKTSENFENTLTNLSTLSGSDKKGQALFNKLQDFANNSTFSTSDIQGSLQQMMSFGIDPDKSLSVLKEIGDISLGDKQKLQSLALAYAQINAQGSMQGQDRMQLINGGFPVWQALQQVTGKSTAELKKMEEQGQITASMIDQAFKKATSSGGMFYKGMDKAKSNMSGLLSTAKDKLELLINELNKPLFSELEKGLKGAISLFDKLYSVAKSMPDGLKLAISKVLIGLAAIGPALLVIHKGRQLLDNLKDGFEIAKTAIIGLITKFEALDVVESISDALQDPVKLAIAGVAAGAATAGVILLIKHTMDSLNSSVGDSKDTTDDATDSVSNLDNAVNSTNNDLSNTTGTLNNYTSSVDSATASTVDLNEKMKETVDKINETADGWANATNMFDQYQHKTISAQTLYNNMLTQANAMREFSAAMSNLSSRGLNSMFLQALYKEGPSNADELKALSGMSDDMLKSYENMWNYKYDMAQQQSVNYVQYSGSAMQPVSSNTYHLDIHDNSINNDNDIQTIAKKIVNATAEEKIKRGEMTNSAKVVYAFA